MIAIVTIHDFNRIGDLAGVIAHTKTILTTASFIIHKHTTLKLYQIYIEVSYTAFNLESMLMVFLRDVIQEWQFIGEFEYTQMHTNWVLTNWFDNLQTYKTLIVCYWVISAKKKLEKSSE